MILKREGFDPSETGRVPGLWEQYRPGAVPKALSAAVDLFIRQGVAMTARVGEETAAIRSAADLAGLLERFEKNRGVAALIEELAEGIEMTAQNAPGGGGLLLLLRSPGGEGGRRQEFIETVADGVVNDERTFIEKYFRSSTGGTLRPILERILTRKFGFSIEYKVLTLRGAGGVPGEETKPAPEPDAEKVQLRQELIVAEHKLEIATQRLHEAYHELTALYQEALGKPVSLWDRLKAWYTSHITWLVIPSLVAGVVAAKLYPPVLDVALPAIDGFIEGLLVLAPIAIFVILTPTVAKLLKTRRESRFAGFVVLWFLLTRLAACTLAALLAWAVFGLSLSAAPAASGPSFNFVGSLRESAGMLLSNIFIQVTGISIVAGIVVYFVPPLYRLFHRAAQSVESLGDVIEPVLPLFMFLLGAFIYGLPTVLAKELEPGALAALAKEIRFLGIPINLRGEFGLMWVYAVESVVVAMACFLWQGFEILVLKGYVKDFSLAHFVSRYWVKVYPLAWSTSSEKLAMPLNMSSLKKSYKNVSDSIRRLVLGLGAFLNQNGTSMDVIFLATICGIVVGHPPSLLTLLLAIPLIVVIGYGVPGIPGEQVIYAIPIAAMMGIPLGPLSQAFLAIFVAIQLGLPDSFRSGTNVTDNGIYAIGLNQLYERRYTKSP